MSSESVIARQSACRVWKAKGRRMAPLVIIWDGAVNIGAFILILNLITINADAIAHFYVLLD